MFNSAHDRYLESRVLSADPLELVRMLYQGVIGEVQDARHQLAAGNILERARAISRASAILIELSVSLDRERGGEIADRLAGLYDYMQKRLLEGNLKQLDAPLGEVLGLLNTLAEGWAAIAKPAVAAASAASPWSQPGPQEPEERYAGASWSL